MLNPMMPAASGSTSSRDLACAETRTRQHQVQLHVCFLVCAFISTWSANIVEFRTRKGCRWYFFCTQILLTQSCCCCCCSCSCCCCCCGCGGVTNSASLTCSPLPLAGIQNVCILKIWQSYQSLKIWQSYQSSTYLQRSSAIFQGF